MKKFQTSKIASAIGLLLLVVMFISSCRVMLRGNDRGNERGGMHDRHSREGRGERGR